MIQLSGAEFIKGHADYGEIFTEWRLWEAARACFNFFHKKYKMLPELVATMGGLCDFLHPRLHSTIVLQNIQFVTNALCATLYDGIKESDLKMLIMELTKLCVCWLNYCYFLVSVCCCYIYTFCFDFKISYFIMRHVTPLWCSTLLFFVSHFSVCLNESLSYIRYHYWNPMQRTTGYLTSCKRRQL